jgi:hypothetical protein
MRTKIFNFRSWDEFRHEAKLAIETGRPPQWRHGVTAGKKLGESDSLLNWLERVSIYSLNC